MSRSRLLFLSSTAVPHQVGFCNALQDHFEAQTWFYEHPDRTRGAWWRVDLGEHCKVLDHVLFKEVGPFEARYLAVGLENQLERFNPDIVMLGGFSIPSNYLAYRWARRKGKKTIAFTERSRDARGALRKRGLPWRLHRWLYRDLDLVMVSADDAVEQFRDEFGFGGKVVAGRYAADLDRYFEHPLREAKAAYTYLFANRLTDIYDPLLAIGVFANVHSRFPESRLVMNAAGELGDACRARIGELHLGSAVEFLTELRSWDDLPAVYARCDILLFPAKFSNGNFTILEAMASGMGLVLSDRILGVGKLVRDGVNGFNCPHDFNSILCRVNNYIDHPELLKGHARLNRPLVEPHSAGGTAAFFAKIIKERLGV